MSSRAPSGRGEFLQWINSCCGAHYTSVEGLADGVLYNQLMETLVKKTAQAQSVVSSSSSSDDAKLLEQHQKAARTAEAILAKVQFAPRGKEDNEANLHLLHDCLRRCVLPRKNSCEVKVDRLAEGKLQDHMVFLKWIYQHTQKVHQLIQKAATTTASSSSSAAVEGQRSAGGQAAPSQQRRSSSATVGGRGKKNGSELAESGGAAVTERGRQPTALNDRKKRSSTTSGGVRASNNNNKAAAHTLTAPNNNNNRQQQRLPPPTHDEIDWNEDEREMMAGYNPNRFSPSKGVRDSVDEDDDHEAEYNDENEDDDSSNAEQYGGEGGDAVSDLEIAEICGELQAVEERLALSLNQQSGIKPEEGGIDENGYPTSPDVDFGTLQELLMDRDALWQNLAFVAEVVENKTAQIEVAKQHGRLNDIVVTQLLAELSSVFSAPASQLDRI